MNVVGKSIESHTLFYDDKGRIREGTVIVKLVGKCGPYGYRVHYQRGFIGRGHHVWKYLGLAEPGLSIGSYAPGVPLVFYQGRQRDIRNKTPVLVGNWDGLLVETSLDQRLESGGYLEEVLA